jgi:hypothetical protein
MKTMKTNYELVFAGGAMVKYMPRYRRNHKTVESAQDTARTVWEKLQERGLPTACHTPIVYGPGCGRDGKCVNPW